MKEGGGTYSPEDRKRANFRLVLDSVVHCETTAAPRFVTLRFNEVAERNGLEPVTQDAVEKMLEELKAAGYLTSSMETSLLSPGRKKQPYYKRTSKQLPDDPGTPPRTPSAPAAVKSRPPAEDGDEVAKRFRRS